MIRAGWSYFSRTYACRIAKSGFELAQEARDRNPSLKVLYTTGEIVSDRMKVLYVDGAKMLPKPYTDVELEDAILATLRGP